MTKEQKFETFWKCYPRRVAKGAARKAFEKAVKKASLETMLKAITEYVAKKPEKIDFKHPATWLNGECWDDEWEPQQTRAPMRSANYGHAAPVERQEPLTPEEREKRRQMAERARAIIRGLPA